MTKANACHEYDVLVVGAGIAGLRSAIEASAEGARVAVLSKSLLGKASSILSYGALEAQTSGDWKEHFKEIMLAGMRLNQCSLVRDFAEQHNENLPEIEKWGGWLPQERSAMGRDILRTLQDRAVQVGVEFFMEFSVVHLLQEQRNIHGALALDQNAGEFHVFLAPSIILATGNYGGIYENQSGHQENTGDGYALAYVAGAELVDMEFSFIAPLGLGTQNHSRGMYLPSDLLHTHCELKDEKGNPVLVQELSKPIAPTKLARALQSVIDSGNAVVLHVLEANKRAFPRIEKILHLMGKEVSELPIFPTYHESLGGIRVEPQTLQATTVQGLFACGACLGGFHGGGYLEDVGLSSAIHFAKKAGKQAALYCKDKTRTTFNSEEVSRMCRNLQLPFKRRTGTNPFAIYRELQETMQQFVGINKAQVTLHRALSDLTKYWEKAAQVKLDGPRQHHSGWQLALELRNSLIVAELVIQASLKRRESRGLHVRTDFPQSTDELATSNTVISLKHGKMETSLEDVEAMPETLANLF